ncbi:MAG: hypothetical protein GQ531_01295, partial [Sulfurovum sp.]|nr:hypothetical protein [Sulfurovum sp.]
MKMNLLKNTIYSLAALCMLTVMSSAEEVTEKPKGILPLADYSGDLSSRSHLFGELGGKRSEWAEKGFAFDIDFNQYYQGVVDGGVDTASEYGGTINYNISIDFDRMGLIPGGLLELRAVSRYGKSVNSTSGALIAVNTDATHPFTNPAD